MDRLFRKIGSFIESKPIKTLLITIVVFAICIAGVSNMRMATGNETLVQTDNEVYISNKQMEESFGGDSILILFTDKEEGNLFTLENIQKMWQVEQRFQYEDNIFSFMSPASIVHQLTQRQSTEIKKQVLTLSDGLAEMKGKMSGLAFGAFATMGDKLGDVSKGLATFHSKSDMMIADIPGSQEELDNVLYDENGQMRSLFSNVVINDKNSLMVVKLTGHKG